MPWQEGQIAKNDAGDFQVNIGGTWTPAPKGSVAQDATGKYQYNSDSFAAPKAPPPPETDIGPPLAPAQPSVGRQIVDMGKDLVKPVARAVGTAQDIVTGNNKDATYPTADKYGAYFDHPDDQEPILGMAKGLTGMGATTNALGGGVKQVAQIPAVHDAFSGAANSNVGRTIGEVARPVADLASGVGEVAGLRAVASPLRQMADEGVNAVLQPSATQKATVASNPLLSQTRAAGFKLGGSDVRAAVNAPDAAIPGPTVAAPDTLDNIQRHNQAHATASMTSDVGLPNTAAVSADDISGARKAGGAVYDELGSTIGPNAQVSPKLSQDIANAGPKDGGSPKARADSQAQVDFYQNEFKDGKLNGPDAVQTVRQLRRSAYKQMGSMEPDTQTLGQTNLKIADSIEDEMMRQVPADSDLTTRFPAARTQLAKLAELESVTDGGQVNAQKVLQLKRAGAPLSGASLDVANAADVAPDSMTRAGGTPTTVTTPANETGVVRAGINIGKRVLHALPGNDPSTDAYQAAKYGPVGKPPVVAPEPPPVAMGPPVPPPPAPVAPELAVGMGRGSPTRRPTKSGPGSPLIPEAPVAAGPDPALAVGQGRASPTPSPTRSGLGTALLPESPVEAPPVGLSVGEGRASPTRNPTPSGGPSGYADVPEPHVLKLEPPEGQAFQEMQRPLVRSGVTNAEGDLMAPANWDRAALDRVQQYQRQMFPEASKPVLGVNPRPYPNDSTEVATSPRNVPAQVQGSEEFAASRRKRKLSEGLFNQNADNAE